MEIYRADSTAEPLLKLHAEIESAAAALKPWLQGQRHREVFLPLA
jgi:hypothetical protein